MTRLSLARPHALKGSTAQGCDSDRHSEMAQKRPMSMAWEFKR